MASATELRLPDQGFGPEGSGLELICGPVRAVVAPALGGQLVRLQYNGVDYLDNSTPYSAKPGIKAGAPLLFPTPNRTANARYTYRGKKYHQAVAGQSRVIHGLVHDQAFSVEGFAANDEWAACTLVYTHGADKPSFGGYPFPCVLEVTWRVTAERLKLEYTVRNTGEQTLPFGFAWHPYFPKTDASRIRITVDATEFYQAVDCFPTGKRLTVADNPAWDLRGGRSLADLDVDDVYTPITPATTIRAEYLDRGVAMNFFGTEDFSHLVVFTPQKKPFFCIENQTCCTDAINLHSRELVSTGLMELGAGESCGGNCGIVFSQID